MDSHCAEEVLIHQLQTSDSTEIYGLFYDHLRPLTESNKTLTDSVASFLPFLEKCLSILSNRIPKVFSHSNAAPLLEELLRVYDLCLKRMEDLSFLSNYTPFSVEMNRIKFMSCLKLCNRFKELKDEGYKILRKLPRSREDKLLPEELTTRCKDLPYIVVNLVVMLVHCEALAKREDADYMMVLKLVEEVNPWLGELDSSLYMELHDLLVSHLTACTSNLLENRTPFPDRDLVNLLCRTVLRECKKLPPIKNNGYKVVESIYTSLFELPDYYLHNITDMLGFIIDKWKVVEESTETGFVELVDYCVKKCQSRTANFCCTFAEYLNKIAEHFKQVTTPINSILRLYAAGLLLISCDLRTRTGDLASSNTSIFKNLVGTLLKNEKILPSSQSLLDSFHSCSKSNCMSSSVEDQCFAGQQCTLSGFNGKLIGALKFLCLPLSNSIIAESNQSMQQVLTDVDDASARSRTMVYIVQDAFHILCNHISSTSFMLENNGDGFDDNSLTVLHTAVAAFTLSITTNHKVQESEQLIEIIIDSKWIDEKRLNCIGNCLHKIAEVLVKVSQKEMVLKVLNLSCKALWLCVKCHCANMSEDALKDVVMKACTISVHLLHLIYYDVKNLEMNKKLIEILEFWFTAYDLYERLPAPIPVINLWVKIRCKHVAEVDDITLFCLLSSSSELSKRKIAVILEQELTAYEEMCSNRPKKCQKMQMKIINILLQHIYITPESRFQKAQTLVRKGKAYRVWDIVDLRGCIQCLSEAITIMNKISCEKCTYKNPIDHQLCATYCLRAICTLEAEANSKQIFEDVKAALALWLSIFEEGDCSALSDSMMILLYNVVGLLQLKGFMELFNDAYRLVIKMFERKNVSIENWLSLLWNNRSLSHALCVSPVNEEFINNSLDKFSELSNIDMWIHYFKGNQSSSIGFQQNFSFLFASSDGNSCSHGSSFRTDITVDEVKKVAHDLQMSNDHVQSHSTFLAGCLFYDMCPRLVANGRLKEALSSAKEALKLHAKLFRSMFKRIDQQQNNEHNVIVDSSMNISLDLSVAREVFLFDSRSWDLKDSYLSAWKVMQCFLESSLQIGIIHEMIGNTYLAESYLKAGKAISCSLKLPLFTIAFSSALGNLYVKKRLWDIAETELRSAEKILNESNTQFGCSKCKLKLEVTLHEYLGDLCQSKFDTRDTKETAEKCYASALDKLNLFVWKSLSCPKDDNDGTATDIKCPASMRNWNHLQSEDVKSGLLNGFINLKWEFVWRQLLMKLLSRVVKCSAYSDQIDETPKFLLRSISALVSRDPLFPMDSLISLDDFRQLVAREIPGDVFTIQRAEIVHDICWYSLKSYHSNFARKIFCTPSSITFEDLAAFMMVAFVLSREVPVIFQEVSKLLAVMCLVSSFNEQFSVSFFSKALGGNFWSSYFHQASIGTHVTDKFLSHLTGKYKGSHVTGSSSIRECTSDLLSPVPDTTVNLAVNVEEFFTGLPSTTIICLSLLGRDYISLLQELLRYSTSVNAWMLVSRLRSKNEPIVMLLPVNSTLKDVDVLSTGQAPKYEEPTPKWNCPWGFTVVDDVAPAYRAILEENYLTAQPLVEKLSLKSRGLRLEHRQRVDSCLDNLLRGLEDLWFGSWKYLLLGEWLNCKNFDLVLENLVNDLKSQCKLDVSVDLLKIILKCGCDDRTALVSKLCSKKDCYISKVGYCNQVRKGILLNAANESGKSSEIAFDLLSSALNGLEVDYSMNREPIILVLDYEVQMLPWENLPILTNQEVYRMPSVSCISAVLHKGSNQKEQVGRNLAPFASIDPLNAFYLLNPEGDLIGNEELEKYLKDQRLKGKVHLKPTIKELASELKCHDLFIYSGHGSGQQYIPLHAIEKLDKCAATLLLGCSSCSLTLHGQYAPVGIPPSYLLAGSPFIIGTLWEVDADINRFGKALLDAWFKERSDKPTECSKCKLSGEFEAPQKKLAESEPPKNCGHRRNIGAFMGQAREACTLRSIAGASTVCYGVPTGIWRKRNV